MRKPKVQLPKRSYLAGICIDVARAWRVGSVRSSVRVEIENFRRPRSFLPYLHPMQVDPTPAAKGILLHDTRPHPQRVRCGCA